VLDDASNPGRSCVLSKVLGWRELRSCRAVLVLVPVAFALVACGRFAFPPVPDGKAAEVLRSQTATMWGDGAGGRLELKPDGTFASYRAVWAWPNRSSRHLSPARSHRGS
jgi:hypothetical protein